jgi:pimeloyl-ACP methyl ester carboxylesterase
MISFDSDGCRFHVTESGHGPLVLLIHGTAANLWGRVPDLLAPSHRVISYDRRSFGRSTAPPQASLRQHTDDAAELLRHSGGAPATVVGWSTGGIIALDLLATRPELVAGAVILEAPLFAKRHPRPEMLARILAAKLTAARGRPRAGAEQFLRWALTRRGESNDLDRLPPSWREAMLNNAAAILGEVDAGTGERELDREALARVVNPVLWLTGDRSARSFTAAARRATPQLAAATWVAVEHCGHVLQHDNPIAVAEAVLNLDTKRREG